MSKPYKLLLFTIIVSAVTISIIVYRYEQLLSRQKNEEQLSRVPGGTPANVQYTAAEIIDLIKKTKEYLGDSITIFEDGEITSSNGKFQGTIKAVTDSKDNMNIVRNNIKTNRLPLQYNVYVLAATYYRQQYASEFEKK